MIQRLFPKEFGNRFPGHRLALWLLGLFLALKLVMSTNSILNTASIASGPDGFALERYGTEGAAAVLMLFALNAVGQLTLVLLSILALVRYKAMVPLLYLVWLLDQTGRRLLVESYAVERSGSGGTGFWINMGLLMLLAVGAAVATFTTGRRAPS